jgi:hypothetical protein
MKIRISSTHIMISFLLSSWSYNLFNLVFIDRFLFIDRLNQLSWKSRYSRNPRIKLFSDRERFAKSYSRYSISSALTIIIVEISTKIKRKWSFHLIFQLFYRFERSLFSRNEIVNSLLLIQESKMRRTRDRSQDAKNINKRKQVFEVFTSRVSSQFERVEMKTAIINNEEISTKRERVIWQADLISRREQEWEREREQAREQERERARAQEQEQGPDRSRNTRDRDRERDETIRNEIETVKNENKDDKMKNVLAAK